jgi:UDP-glucose 4-epimerase
MILVTGGLGSIGSHTARALLDRGESVVVTAHRTLRPPAFLAGEPADRLVVEPLDCADRAAFLRLGERHPLDAILHLAGTGGVGGDPVGRLRTDALGVLNALEAAREWGVRRICYASSIGVYVGVQEIPWREDAALPMSVPLQIPTAKRAAELYAGLAAAAAGVPAVGLRIGTVYGPLGDPDSPFFPVPRLITAAVRGADPALGPPRPSAYAEDAADLCYVKDCADALATLTLADRLRHDVYNVSGGGPVTNAEAVAALRAAVPGFDVTLPPGRAPGAPERDGYLDTTRLRAETGYRPAYDVARGVADYVAWLRGNPR